jgi:hypothetical protein
LFCTVKLCIFVYLWQIYESMECMCVPIFILRISGILECLVFLLLKHCNPLSLAFAIFTTDAHSVLFKSPCSSPFYTLIPEVHFNIIHPPRCGSSFFSPFTWYTFQYLVYWLLPFLHTICPSYSNSNTWMTVTISGILHLL